MTKLAKGRPTAEILVTRFTEICIAQEDAQRWMRISQYNRLYRQMIAVLDQLKSMDGDQRRLLVPLYTHPKVQVRLKAAIHTLLFEPTRAMEILQRIKDSQDFPFAADAHQILDGFIEGRYVPN